MGHAGIKAIKDTAKVVHGMKLTTSTVTNCEPCGLSKSKDYYFTNQGYASRSVLKAHGEYDMIAVRGGTCRLHIVHPLLSNFRWNQFTAGDLEDIQEHLKYVIDHREGGTTFQAAVKTTKANFDAYKLEQSTTDSTTTATSMYSTTDTKSSGNRTIRGKNVRRNQPLATMTPILDKAKANAPVSQDRDSSQARIHAWQDGVPGGYRQPSVASSGSWQVASFYTASEKYPASTNATLGTERRTTTPTRVLVDPPLISHKPPNMTLETVTQRLTLSDVLNAPRTFSDSESRPATSPAKSSQSSQLKPDKLEMLLSSAERIAKKGTHEVKLSTTMSPQSASTKFIATPVLAPITTTKTAKTTMPSKRSKGRDERQLSVAT